MNTLLENPAVRELISPMSVEEYHQLPEYNARGKRTELLQGIVIEKMSKSPLHRTIQQILVEFFRDEIPEGFSVWQDQPLTFIDSEPEPDISIVAGGNLDFAVHHPSTAELVIEVAVTSLDLDHAKREIYAQAGVKEYWIVCPGQCVEVYRRPSGGKYQESGIHYTGKLSPQSFPEIRLDLLFNAQ